MQKGPFNATLAPARTSPAFPPSTSSSHPSSALQPPIMAVLHLRGVNEMDGRSMSSLEDYSDSEGPPNKMMKGGIGSPRLRDGRELIQCPTIGCDGMGHVSGNYATHRR